MSKRRFKLSLDKSVPWWIRWRPSVRRWLRDAEKQVEEKIEDEDLRKSMRELIETGQTELVKRGKR